MVCISRLGCATFRVSSFCLPSIEQSEAGEYDERKFQKLQEKTDYVRREFNLPDTEDVIQGTRSSRTCDASLFNLNYLVN